MVGIRSDTLELPHLLNYADSRSLSGVSTKNVSTPPRDYSFYLV